MRKCLVIASCCPGVSNVRKALYAALLQNLRVTPKPFLRSGPIFDFLLDKMYLSNLAEVSISLFSEKWLSWAKGASSTCILVPDVTCEEEIERLYENFDTRVLAIIPESLTPGWSSRFSMGARGRIRPDWILGKPEDLGDASSVLCSRPDMSVDMGADSFDKMFDPSNTRDRFTNASGAVVGGLQELLDEVKAFLSEPTSESTGIRESELPAMVRADLPEHLL